MPKWLHGGALESHDGAFRYHLNRELRHTDPVMARHTPDLYQRLAFVMLNPSTASGTEDDPTIRRCVGFAQREGCVGIDVVNLCPFRATDPTDLLLEAPLVEDEVMALNDKHLAEIAGKAWRVVVAWGSNGDKPAIRPFVNRALTVLRGQTNQLWCLGTTKSGQPKHPLYIRGDQPLVLWKVPGA